MQRRSIALPIDVAPGCAEWADSANTLWLATSGGDIATLRLFDQQLSWRGGGYVQPVAVLPAEDGLGLIVAEAGGTLWSVARDGAARSEAAVLAVLDHALAAARLHPDGGAMLVLEASSPARLLRVALADGSTTTLADALESPSALAVDAATRTAVVLEQPPSGARWLAISIDSGAVTDLAAADDATAIVSAPGTAGPGVVVASGPNGNLQLIGLAGTPGTVGPDLGSAVRALGRWGSLVLAVTASGVEAIEWGLDEAPLPLQVPLGPAFVGGWFRAGFDPALVGVAASDVQLVVDEGPDAGYVSAGVEPAGAAGLQQRRVLCGPIPGEYHLNARRISDGALLGRARFRVTRHWPDPLAGPPLALTGKQQYFMQWGGGPNAAQNIGTHAVPDEWRVGIVYVSTSNRRLPPDLAALDQTWTDRLTGPGLSARRYYEEVSYFSATPPLGSPRGTTIRHAGPTLRLELPQGWGDYFEQPTGKGNWYGWNPKQTVKQELAGALSDLLADSGRSNWLAQVDAVLFVVQTASEGMTVVGTKLALSMFVWPQAWRGIHFYRKTVHPGGTTNTAFQQLPIVLMPTHTPSRMPATEKMQSTNHTHILCHELGHTMGCDDLYNGGDFTAEVEARSVGSLDLMGNDGALPHYSMANRMRLGWVADPWIERVDFSVNASSRTVVLQAAEAIGPAGPPPGRKAAIEVRVRDGWNYYFEYRRTQPGQLGDQGLNTFTPASSLVLGTDVVVMGETGPMAGADGDLRRPRIVLLPQDADGDGAVLDTLGEDYEESDQTNADAPHDFRLRFDGPDGPDANAARVFLEYIAARHADLRISPAPGQGNWKSPDIDLEGPKGMNTAAKGLAHQIVIRVLNAGTEDARSVRVRVGWLPFTTSPGAWNALPDPPRQDIGKGKTVEFRVPWTPPKSVIVAGKEAEHFCVRVDIDRYVDPSDPTHSEIVVGNNWAQSNFDSTEVAHGSPSERRSTGVVVTNRLAREATYLTAVDQDHALLRVYLGNAWLRLPPGETAVVDVDYESLAGDPLHGAQFAREFELLARRPPPMLSLSALVVPEDQGWTTPRTVWGANLIVRIGQRTRVRIEGLFERMVRGHVHFIDNGNVQAVSRGQVNVVLWTAERPDEQFTSGDAVDLNGRFDVVIPREIDDARRAGVPILAEALYLGTWPWAASRSGMRRLT